MRLSRLDFLPALDDVTGPFTMVILLLNGLHGEDQSNENHYIPQKNLVTN